jgi:hypothetical protein
MDGWPGGSFNVTTTVAQRWGSVAHGEAGADSVLPMWSMARMRSSYVPGDNTAMVRRLVRMSAAAGSGSHSGVAVWHLESSTNDAA